MISNFIGMFINFSIFESLSNSETGFRESFWNNSISQLNSFAHNKKWYEDVTIFLQQDIFCNAYSNSQLFTM